MNVAMKIVPQDAALAVPTLPAGNKFMRRIDIDVIRYLARIPGGLSKEDCLKPEFWRHQVAIMKEDAVITCLADDGSFDIDVRVVRVFTASASVRLIRDCPIGAAPVLAEEIGVGWFTKWISPTHRWAIMTPEQKEFKHGFASQKDAATAMAEHIASLKAAKA